MNIGVIAHIKIKSGFEAQFEAIIARHADIIKKTEPDNLLYRLFRSPDDVGSYTFMEIYRSREAFDLHRANVDFEPGREEIARIRDGVPTLTVLTAV